MNRYFSDNSFREQFGFKTGTAWHKLSIQPPARYSADVDLVQTSAAPLGPEMDK